MFDLGMWGVGFWLLKESKKKVIWEPILNNWEIALLGLFWGIGADRTFAIML